MNAYSVNVQLINDDCLIALKTLADNSVDSVVTDPPYGLNFMGKEWDRIGDTSADFTNLDKPHISQESFPMKKSRGRPICETDGKAQQDWHLMWAKECLRVLKPGGFLLAFGGSRTYHRMACAIEDAGFEIRDQIMWVYGSGFPKSLNIEKAINKIDGVAFESKPAEGVGFMKPDSEDWHQTKNMLTQKGESSDRAKQWNGWGTALKPSHEPIVLARKLLSEKTVVENVLKWGVGGINIDACRVKYIGKTDPRTFGGKWKTDKAANNVYEGGYAGKDQEVNSLGRFPANFIHDGSEEVLNLFPDTKGTIRKPTGKGILNPETGWNNNSMVDKTTRGFSDEGSAGRFFYCAKASSKERNGGLEEMPDKPAFNFGSIKKSIGRHGENTPRKNTHPTVKPLSLMVYLTKLVTPKNGIVLDPFTGSGTTAIACIKNDFRFIGFEKQKEYFDIAKLRIERSSNGKENQ